MAPREARAARAAPQQAPDRTLYVGNLPYDATEEEVRTLINGAVPDGVVRVHLPMDADGRKRGFGFVTMASAEVAKTAADSLRSADLRSRRLVVNLAHPKGDRPAGGGGGGGGGFGGQPSFGGPSFGGGAGGGPPKKAFEEKRKRTFDDGGGAKAGARKKAKERGGANKLNYGSDDDD